MIAKCVFEALGAKVSLINAEPNGLNINREAGSTHIENLCNFVRQNGLELGFAFDGDADRCIAVDENGNEVNGDHILYILGTDLKKKGQLVNNTVVTTIMSNIGLYKALEKDGIDYVQTTVGDRFIYENMVQTGNCIGGEQSGHVILSKYATTGDGILTAIKIMEVVIASKLPLSKLAAPVKMFPQVLRNIRVENKAAVRENADVQALKSEIEKKLGKNGRILLRESGTEPVVRVMVEGPSRNVCEEYADQMIAKIREKGLAED